MKKLLTIIFVVLLFSLYLKKDNNVKIQYSNIYTDSCSFYYNTFFEKFGGMCEEDMDSIVNCYSFLIGNLEDTIKKNISLNKDSILYNIEVELKHEYVEKYEEACFLRERYFFNKNISDSILLYNL